MLHLLKKGDSRRCEISDHIASFPKNAPSMKLDQSDV